MPFVSQRIARNHVLAMLWFYGVLISMKSYFVESQIPQVRQSTALPRICTSPGWRIAVFVVCVEYVCADEVCDCGLCTVSIDGTDGLSVEKSCGYSAYCISAVFGGLLFHVVCHVCASLLLPRAKQIK
jgi:hypothetical protein